MKHRDITNETFDRLTARWPVGYGGTGRHFAFWLFSCRCGSLVVRRVCDVRGLTIHSCGCLRIEIAVARFRTASRSNIKHGHNRRWMKTRVYSCWGAMIQRCTNPKHPKWKDYGGRGIQVCERWRYFVNFLADMGPMPKGKTIDRYPDNNGNYEPGNSRWATPKQQQQNRRVSKCASA